MLNLLPKVPLKLQTTQQITTVLILSIKESTTFDAFNAQYFRNVWSI